MSDTLKMVDQIEANEGVVMQIYDMCNDKKEYKKFLEFCKKVGKEFRGLQKEAEDTKIFQIKKVKINDSVDVTATIQNYNPSSYNHNSLDIPLEISVNISDDSKNGLTTKGSAFFGGCNEAEYNEFIGIITSGYHDFTKEY